MNIVCACSECVPFVKIGGLGDVIGALPKSLKKLDHDVRIVIPLYTRKIDTKKYGLKPLIPLLQVQWGAGVESFSVHTAMLADTIPVYFIDHQKYFDRDNVYGPPNSSYPDNAERFIFFCKAVLETTKALNFQPDIIHAHDWTTALLPTLLKTAYRNDSFFYKTRSVLTIHNIDYQGVFPPYILSLAGLTWDVFTPEKMEFFGAVNILKGGIVFSDALTTVSKQYAEEIMAAPFGRGLEGVVKKHKDTLYGIVNGVDYETWNPGTDTHIAEQFSAKKINAKATCKKQLQEIASLPQRDVPIIAMISRIVAQKGFDIVHKTFDELMKLDVQFVLLGVGDPEYHRFFEDMMRKHPDKVRAFLQFSDELSHKIYAGADMLLMPSEFEPCGISQLISFAYGVVPIVAHVGGLVDTVDPFDENISKGSGIVLEHYSAEALLFAVTRAVNAFYDKKMWAKRVKHIMSLTFSWDDAAKEYNEVYKTIKN